ncbi:DNA polymerase III subunit alpha, putative [Babesia ovis]|uniref:DNA polymerase III subunit alpha, putative n=1 Tax=Babesia ovis TaxID=5869 RepID=A0A9W5TCI9_BABOV|nr:DNA polymerase III subunit alpha, putative [Babesia ovis]
MASSKSSLVILESASWDLDPTCLLFLLGDSSSISSSSSSSAFLRDELVFRFDFGLVSVSSSSSSSDSSSTILSSLSSLSPPLLFFERDPHLDPSFLEEPDFKPFSLPDPLFNGLMDFWDVVDFTALGLPFITDDLTPFLTPLDRLALEDAASVFPG